jgi:para-aminobenzoate synthetase component 1
MERRAYVAMVRRALEYIAAGDIYQVNLAQCFRVAGLPMDGRHLWRIWQRDYPMPFAAYIEGPDWQLVSGSPECFLTVDGREIATFPIKGTRPAPAAVGGSKGLLTDDLRSDAKERAEHVMVVDLERNDLGRVCEPGSVMVSQLETIREFPLLRHMISEVRGILRADVSLPEIVTATFPGGSITGAPKVRAMQVIEELEPVPRGFYTGAIGWTDFDGRSRFNIAIRTAVLGQNGIRYHAGGGIVADSDPEREYEETILKTEAFRRALQAVSDGSAEERVEGAGWAARTARTSE